MFFHKVNKMTNFESYLLQIACGSMIICALFTVYFSSQSSAEQKEREKYFQCNGVCEAVVEKLKSRWGNEAKIYWNESGYVVISKDGYVSEFNENGLTIHSGDIR